MGRGAFFPKRKAGEKHGTGNHHRRHEPLGTLAGSFAGIYVSGSLTQYRLRQLEEKVNRHNNLIERTFKLEQECAVLEERVRAADRRIDGLEEEHI